MYVYVIDLDAHSLAQVAIVSAFNSHFYRNFRLGFFSSRFVPFICANGITLLLDGERFPIKYVWHQESRGLG